MNITSIPTLSFNKYSKIISQKTDNCEKQNSTELPKLCANQIYFTAGLTTKSDRIFDNIKNIEKLYGEIFTPAKLKFIENFDEKAYDLFNKFFNKECSKVIIKKIDKLTYALTGLEDDNSNFVIKLSKTEKNNQNFLRISYSKDATPPNVLLVSPTKICTENNTEKYLNNYDLQKLPHISMFDEGGKKIIENLSNFKYFVALEISNAPQKYFMETFKNSLDLINNLTDKLNTIEHSKRYAIKNSYKGYLPFPRKTTFQLKDLQNSRNMSYAIIPHKSNNNNFFRLLQLNTHGEIEDAYLINTETGVVKNYCPAKKFNWASTAHTPLDQTVMTDSELTNTGALKILSRYYNALSDFYNYVDKASTKSFKVLNKEYNANDSIGYNSIKKTFLDKIPEILPPSNNCVNIDFPNGEKFVLSKEKEHNFNIIKLTYEKDNKFITTKINADTTKIFQTNQNGEIIFDSKQNPLYVNSKSNAFRFKTKLMKDFIQEALKTKNVNISDSLQLQMQNLKENFINSDEIWKNMSRTKKTDFTKIFQSIVQARGNTGEIRFQIPNRDYQLGLKPQKLDSSEFMRFSIYDNDGKLQKAFLINDFTKIVDNYCTKGYTKDSISRIPPNIIYKTEEQIKAENIDILLAEYQEELSKFHTVAKDFAIDKRLR